MEKREKGEVFSRETGPSIEELVTDEDVDILAYMGWEQGADEVVGISGEDLVREAFDTAMSAMSSTSIEVALDVAKEQVRIICIFIMSICMISMV